MSPPATVRRLKLGLVGVGLVAAEKHLPALRRVPEIQVVALADPNLERCQEVARRFGIGVAVADAKILLKRDDLDAVGLCTPPETHVELGLLVLASGRHLLVEKPLALDRDQADRLVEAARKSGLRCATGHHMRWHRLVREAREVVRSGQLGEIESVRGAWNASTDGVALPAWRLDRAQGGGALFELAVHHFDLWRFLLDAEIEEVFAFTRSAKRTDDAAVVVGRLSNGALASATFSERTSPESELEVAGNRARVHLSCLRFEGLAVHPTGTAPGDPKVRLSRLAHAVRELPRGLSGLLRGGEYLASYENQWRDFAACVREGREPECRLSDGRQAMAASLAAIQSLRSRRAIRLAEAPARVQPS